MLSKLLSKVEKVVELGSVLNAPKGIRIPVAGLKGRCPRPLDDGGTRGKYSRNKLGGQMTFYILFIAGNEQQGHGNATS